MQHKDKLNIVYLPIADLKHPDYNPRQISEHDFEHLKKSLGKFDSVEPAVVNQNPDRKNIIIGGNQRVRAAISLGWVEFPCVYVNLPEKEERELNIRLNKNTGQWDFDILANNFEIDDLTSWGFNLGELDSGGSPNESVDGEMKISPELKESHNYVVLYFDNEIDWKSACATLDIKTLDCIKSKENRRKAGIGRVISGAPIIERLNNCES